MLSNNKRKHYLKNKSKFVYSYVFATKWLRIATRLLDCLLISIFLFLFFFLLNVNRLSYWAHNFATKNFYVPVWMFIVLYIFSFLFILIYFYFFPFFFNGQTLGKKIARIKIISSKTLKKPNCFELLRHELFIIILPLFSLIINFLYLIGTNNNHKLIISLASKNNNFLQNFLISLYFLINSFLFIVLISLILTSKNKGLHDYYANTLVVHIKIKIKKIAIKKKNLFNNNINNWNYQKKNLLESLRILNKKK